jgi:type IX secretion system PorP/SprF family membrane protein
MRKILSSILVLAVGFTAQAQDPHFSQFFSSPLTLNPAFTGKFDGEWRLALNHRDQWPSIPKAYVTTSVSFDGGIMKSKLPNGDVFGLGVSALTDASANGQLKLNFGSASLSYHKALDENGYSTLLLTKENLLSKICFGLTVLQVLVQIFSPMVTTKAILI